MVRKENISACSAYLHSCPQFRDPLLNACVQKRQMVLTILCPSPEREAMKLLLAVAVLGVALASAGPPNSEAPTGFDNKSNSMVDDSTHQVDQAKFDGVETVSDGLGASLQRAVLPRVSPKPNFGWN